MNLLIIGNGAREHALAWKIAASELVKRVFVAPGNAGTALEAENVDIASTDFPRLVKFAQQNEIGLTIVGPEQPLALGIVDAFAAAKLRVFGPSKAAAELEGSKVFCKNLLRHADVPTADYRVFRNPDSAITFLKDREDVPVVVKDKTVRERVRVTKRNNNQQGAKRAVECCITRHRGALCRGGWNYWCGTLSSFARGDTHHLLSVSLIWGNKGRQLGTLVNPTLRRFA